MTAEEKCWTTEDIKIRKEGYIRCAERVIIVKDLEIHTTYGSKDIQCGRGYSNIHQILNCTGVRNICSAKDVDILAIIDDYIEHCWSVANVCIIFDCIPGELKGFMLFVSGTSEFILCK